MKRRRKLRRVEVHQTQIVGNNPLEWIQVQGAFQAGDSRHVFLLAKKTHANVIPQLGGIRGGNSRHPIFNQGHVHVIVILNDATCGKNGFGVAWIVGQRIAEKIKGAVVFPQPQVEQTHRGQNVRIFGGKSDGNRTR